MTDVKQLSAERKHLVQDRKCSRRTLPVSVVNTGHGIGTKPRGTAGEAGRERPRCRKNSPRVLQQQDSKWTASSTDKPKRQLCGSAEVKGQKTELKLLK